MSPIRHVLLIPLFLAASLAKPQVTASTASSTVTAATATPAAGRPNPFVIPPEGLGFKAGQAATVKWQPTTKGTVTIVLRSGNGADLEAGLPVAKNVANSGSFSWTPDESITAGTDYALEIIDDANPANTNYTPFFTIDSTNVKPSATPKFTYGFSSTRLVTAVSKTTVVTSTASVSGSTSASASTTGSASGTSSTLLVAPSAGAVKVRGDAIGLGMVAVAMGALIA